MKPLEDIINRQKTFLSTGKTKNINFRINQLKVLKQAIISNEKNIFNALNQDLNKSGFESYETEIGIVLEEINYMIKHLHKFTKEKRVKTPIMHFLSSSRIYSEPYGVVLIMSPWNYPFQLTLSPLVGSIAAGNCTIIKPSNYSPNTSAVISNILQKCFDERFISVVLGGRDTNKSLLDEKFDYIFFTGSVSVGKIVMEAASKNLTPVTLELGGKSPCIIDETANIELAARRIIWGKLLNSGQTCVAPDYILVKREIKNELILKMKKYIINFYGNEPHNNPEYPRIINQKHFERLMNLMKEGTIVAGGMSNPKTNQIAPTILDNITWTSEIMQEEIFGPLLPIIVFDNLSEIVKQINNKPKPLALYLFTKSKQNEKFILNNISFGGGCINDTVIHVASSYMPFGGIGHSGIGNYHGKASFDTFSHTKSVLKKSNFIDISFRYPPYKNRLNMLKRIMK